MSSLHFPASIVLPLTVLVALGTASRDKRLVLHSDTDIIQTLLNVQAELASFKTQFQLLKDEVHQSHGSVYVRWGKNSCPHNETTLIYKGYMAGKGYGETGSGTNSLCLPEDPTWGNYQDGHQNWRAYIYGAEFEDNGLMSKPLHDQDVPCAVCKIPGVSVMIPARVDCYTGWKLEYTGYLMADYTAYKGFEYVCIDSDPDFVTRGAANTDGHVLYHVEGRCGTLVCPPYYDYRELACAVCSI